MDNEVLIIRTTGLARELVIFELEARVHFSRVLGNAGWRSEMLRARQAEDVPTDSLRPQRWRTQASVLPRVVAPIATGTVAVVRLLRPIALFAPTGIQDNSGVLNRVDLFLDRRQIGTRYAFQELVGRHIPGVRSRWCMLAGVEPLSS